MIVQSDSAHAWSRIIHAEDALQILAEDALQIIAEDALQILAEDSLAMYAPAFARR